jgi:hypothetical protein
VTRHVPRRERWERNGPGEHRSTEGHIVRYEKGAWWADVSYLLPTETGGEALPSWERHTDRLGPYKRPRNAMVEAERHATHLRNRHGDAVRFGDSD